MTVIRPFKALRPGKGLENKIAALPYDVYNRSEAKNIVLQNPLSFLSIDRAETSFDDTVDTYDDKVYQRAKEIMEERIRDGSFVQDQEAMFYLYELTMYGRSQTGIVGCASVDDYMNNIIKKHENTRADKEADRIRHVDVLNAQTGPIFLAYRKNDLLNEIKYEVKKNKPIYDFVSVDAIRHRVWKVSDPNQINSIQNQFSQMQNIYIADGHHRCASAVKVSLMRRKNNPEYTGEKEFNYFLSVLFSEDELQIMDYNRVIKDLNGLSVNEFLQRINDSFTVHKVSHGPYKPTKKGEFGMYLDKQWYKMEIRHERYTNDVVKDLDVSLLQDNLFGPILGINDPKTDQRIDFVGGIRGLEELVRRCNKDCVAAFSMYPTTIQELFSVADAGLLMPPKSTWFEPKLRSGLFIHKLD